VLFRSTKAAADKSTAHLLNKGLMR